MDQHNLMLGTNIGSFEPGSLCLVKIFEHIFIFVLFLPGSCRIYPPKNKSCMWNILLHPPNMYNKFRHYCCLHSKADIMPKLNNYAVIMTYICVFLQRSDALSQLADPRFSPYQGHNSFRDKYFSGITKKNGKDMQQTKENDG